MMLSHDNTSQSDIHSLLKKQNTVTTLQVQQQIASLLLQKRYHSVQSPGIYCRTFIKPFKNSIEKETDNSQYFLLPRSVHEMTI